MSYAPSESFPELIETMKRAAAAFDAAGVPVLLGGGLAAWARGGPPTDHDVDFFVREEHAEAGLAALEEAGMRPERPPEGWLLKAWDGDTLVDLIFRPSGGAVDDEMFARATDIEVMARTLAVASIDAVLATKVLALNEQTPDFRSRSRDRAVPPRAGRLGSPPVARRRLAVRRRVHDPRRAPANRARAGGRGRRGGGLSRATATAAFRVRREAVPPGYERTGTAAGRRAANARLLLQQRSGPHDACRASSPGSG